MTIVKLRLCQILILPIVFSASCEKGSSIEKEDVDKKRLSNIHFISATELMLAIRNQEITSVELLDHFLERIERYNDEINAVVVLDIKGARLRAQEADNATARGESWGPLHGLPITVKEVFEVAGLPLTHGDPSRKNDISENNAVAVQRLIDAGAIVFGKTNIPIFSSDWQSYNKVYGTTNNPWDLSRTPGGSSGGASAALSAGFTALELGTDSGGSIRIPCHFTGVYGHKPTFGIVSRLGSSTALTTSSPAALDKLIPQYVVGPLARCADDLELALEVLVTAGKSEEVAEPIKLMPPRHQNFQDYRVAVWISDPSGLARIDDEVISVLNDMVKKLRKAGVEIDEKARPNIDLEKDLYIHSAISAALLAGAIPLNAILLEKQREQIAKWESFFKEYDLLLAPIAPTTAFPHSQDKPFLDRYLRINGRSSPYVLNKSWMTLAIVAGLPSTAAPIGLSDTGLPVGVQIIGAPLEDRSTIDFARGLSNIVSKFGPPPDYDDDENTIGVNSNYGKPNDSDKTNGLMLEGWVAKDSVGFYFDPLSNAQVCVDQHPEISCSTTDDQGYYVLQGLPINSELVVTLIAEGFVNTAFAITTVKDDIVTFPLSTNIELAMRLSLVGDAESANAIINESEDMPDLEHFIDSLQDPVSDLDVEIDRNLGAIWFRATVIGGDYYVPLSNISVSIEPKKGDGPFYQGLHSEGYFYNLPAGEYKLTFSHPGYDCSLWPLHGYSAKEENTIRVPVLEGFQTDPVGVVCVAK